MPAPLARRPKLKPVDFPYREAYNAVHHGRSYNMGGPNPIPVSEVKAYLEMVGIASLQERLKYLRLIQRLDSTYLTYYAEEAEKKKPKK